MFIDAEIRDGLVSFKRRRLSSFSARVVGVYRLECVLVRSDLRVYWSGDAQIVVLGFNVSILLV